MTQDINAAVTYLQTIAAGISGMRQAPAEPTEQAQFPFAVSYVAALASSVQPSFGHQINLYEIATEIHVARKDLPRDYASIKSYANDFPAAVWGDLNTNGAALDGCVSTINRISGSLQPSTWGGIDTLAWTFRIEVKVNSAWNT